MTLFLSSPANTTPFPTPTTLLPIFLSGSPSHSSACTDTSKSMHINLDVRQAIYWSNLTDFHCFDHRQSCRISLLLYCGAKMAFCVKRFRLQKPRFGGSPSTKEHSNKEAATKEEQNIIYRGKTIDMKTLVSARVHAAGWNSRATVAISDIYRNYGISTFSWFSFVLLNPTSFCNRGTH